MIKLRIFCLVFIFLPTVIYGAPNPELRNMAIEDTLNSLELKLKNNPSLEASNVLFAQSKREMEENKAVNKNVQETPGGTKWFISDDMYLKIGSQIGCIKGHTTYDFNYHTSELEYPMNNWMFGNNLSFGFKDLSLNAEYWNQLEKDAGNDMKDKDWNSSGVLISYTKSKAELEALIWDANLQYDFYKIPLSIKIDELALTGKEDLTIGVVGGYRWERFVYDMYDLEYPDYGLTLYSGTKVAGYRIEYRLPYVGLAAEVSNNNFGLDVYFKYSFNPRAKDIDYHLLRDLTFYGDYDRKRYCYLCRISGFWNMTKNVKFKFGGDGTFIKIDGQTWDETHDPSWDAVQSTEARHWILWSGIEYKF
jgi:outer membrane protease